MSGPPQVIYAHLKYLWATGAREETLAFLKEFTGKLSGDLGLHPNGNSTTSLELTSTGKLSEYTKLLARCYYKLGEWQSILNENWGSEIIPEILESYLLATNLDKTWYKAWHAWALANSEVVAHFAKNLVEADGGLPVQVYTDHLVPSVQGESRFCHSPRAETDRVNFSFLPIDRTLAWKLASRYSTTADSLVQVRIINRSHYCHHGRIQKRQCRYLARSYSSSAFLYFSTRFRWLIDYCSLLHEFIHQVRMSGS